MNECMRYDDLAWERSEAESDQWKRGGVPRELCPVIAGAFNVCLEMKSDDGGSAMIRFPQPGNIRFPDEKTKKEVAVMRFIAEETAIPVPFVLDYGCTKESHENLGPYILMDYIKHHHNMTTSLNTPALVRKDRPILDPDISETTLRNLYGQMADVLLRLSKPAFTQIGSLEKAVDESWSIMSRSLTMNMNELVSLGNFPPKQLPSATYDSCKAYFIAIADMHLTNLKMQRNDAIDSADDCRKKYIARHLFRKLASDGRLSSQEDFGLKPFRLFCDDLLPSIVLLNEEDEIVGVIDWEFTYAAPAIYTFSPPWWLLLEVPENWAKGIADWAKEYEPRLKVFLDEMKKRDVMIEEGPLAQEQRLSGRMRESWNNGGFWISYAARKSWAFDMVFWEFIDQRFFGKCDRWEGRIGLLDREVKEGMEEFVRLKMEQRERRMLDDWGEEGLGTWI